jgi:phospholipid-binding lipoprotein MlaA
MLMLFRSLLLIPIICLPLLFVNLSAEAEAEAVALESEHDDPFYDPFAGKDEKASSVTLQDPLEGFNRAIFIINDKLYFYALKPVAQGYKFVVPEPARKSIKRCFLNIAMPERLVNCAVQGKFRAAGIELWRFIVNTTVGVAGLFDPARELYESSRYAEDSGQTLGYYGVKPGCYLVLPFFGASNIRDTVGLVIDSFLDPFTYLNLSTGERIGIRGYKTVNNTSLRIGEYEDFKKAAVDPYVSLRDGYAQQREKQVSE